MQSRPQDICLTHWRQLPCPLSIFNQSSIYLTVYCDVCMYVYIQYTLYSTSNSPYFSLDY